MRLGRVHAAAPDQEAFTMLLILAVILGIAWLLGFVVFHAASGAIHLLIVLAAIAAIVYFVEARHKHRTAAPRV
jgi:hypothetical protein